MLTPAEWLVGRMTVDGRRHLAVALVLVAALLPSGLTGAGTAAAQTALPGPALQSDPGALKAALSCPDGLSHTERPVVLLVHGHAVTAGESWPAGFGKALAVVGFDWCMVQLPNRSLGDVQTNAEYVVAAVRAVGERTGQKVSLIGHSQGAMEIRWAVRWWPDVRSQVEDLITVAGANRPVLIGIPLCSLSCAPSAWQWSPGSKFMEALNRIPTPDGPAYTTIRSLTDWGRQPESFEPTSPATIDGATNVLVQSLCPGRIVDHIQALFDAAFFAVVQDALEHQGAADPGRVDRGSCGATVPPGVDPVVANVSIATLYAKAFATTATGQRTDREPPLRPYATSN